MLTDTTFWIDLIEERREGHRGPAVTFIAAHRTVDLALSIVTWGELAEGFPEYAEFERFMRGIRVLTLSQQVTWEASRIQRELALVGGRLGENDSWIAATARVWGHRLVSRDEAFRRVPRLRVIPY